MAAWKQLFFPSAMLESRHVFLVHEVAGESSVRVLLGRGVRIMISLRPILFAKKRIVVRRQQFFGENVVWGQQFLSDNGPYVKFIF